MRVQRPLRSWALAFWRPSASAWRRSTAIASLDDKAHETIHRGSDPQAPTFWIDDGQLVLGCNESDETRLANLRCESRAATHTPIGVETCDFGEAVLRPVGMLTHRGDQGAPDVSGGFATIGMKEEPRRRPTRGKSKAPRDGSTQLRLVCGQPFSNDGHGGGSPFGLGFDA